MGLPYSLLANVDFESCKTVSERLTYQSCVEHCGNGIDIWPADQIAERFTLWLVPAVVLVAHFHYASISWANTLIIVSHHFSSPIDSMRSMLARLSIQRRYLHLAELVHQVHGGVRSGYESNHGYLHHLRTASRHEVHADSQHLAVIWCAYDEFGLRDVSKTLDDVEESPLNWPCDDEEWLYIKEAAYQLTNNRTESQLPTWIAVIGYLGAISAAFIRTKRTRQNNQTSHTIAVVALLSYFVPLVLVSSTIGVFRSVPDAVNVLQQLHRNISRHRREKSRPTKPELFPQLQLPTFGGDNAATSDYVKIPNSSMPGPESWDHDLERLRGWLRIAPWTGMNSSWRPGAAVTVNRAQRNHRPRQLLAPIIFVLLGSYIPAVVLSYFSGSLGFGCRCMAWTMVLGVWLTSFGIDYAAKYQIRSPRTQWICTIYKDAICTCFLIGAILAIQVGILNSCYCRANVLMDPENATVNLGGLKDAEWNLNWVVWPSVTVSGFSLMIVFGYLIHIIELVQGSWWRIKFVGGVLCRGEDERYEDLQELVWLSHRLGTAGLQHQLLRHRT
ncbi:hypothetical protein EPUS_01363 [Endocarpon pusillum Z07020]|uniref:Uncharacterized protein n=1 Tax=Endocarpon pusillum (strain Z07020 / HMAS-L-300199) TaxID=1263415 RepID=U1HYR5_ENDPU|nr:uncharacterized protein EPUS_01363 [Endocarpon pusillum Z07020]ERF76030.1 hypothetical protein EPUS_01363 [Endocarpon pusillum Z07020]